MDKILGIFDSALLKDIFYFLSLHPTWEIIADETEFWKKFWPKTLENALVKNLKIMLFEVFASAVPIYTLYSPILIHERSSEKSIFFIEKLLLLTVIFYIFLT